MPSLTMAAAIRGALLAALQDDDRVILLGESVGRAGGIAGTSAGLQDLFGEERVVDLPVSERGTVGMAVGLALAGKRPIVELTSTSRLLAVLEPLAEAASLTPGEFHAPVIVRVPVGDEAGERIDRPMADLDIPGLTVVCASSASSATALLQQAMKASGPVVILEPRALYSSRRDTAPSSSLTTATALTQGEHVTLAAFGTGVHAALDAAEQLAAEGITATVLDLVTLSPLDTDTLGEQTRHTGRVVAVHPSEPALAAKVQRAATQAAFLYLESPPAMATASVDDAVKAARASVYY